MRKPLIQGNPQAQGCLFLAYWVLFASLPGCVTFGQDPSLSASRFSSINNLGNSEASSFSLLSPPLSSAGLATTSSCNLSWALRRRGMPFARDTCQLSRCGDGGPSRESEDLKSARPTVGQPHLAHPAWPLASGPGPHPSTCSFLQWTFVVLRYVLKDLRGFRSRQMASEVAALVGVGCPGSPLIVKIEGQGQSLGGKASVCAGGCAPGRADGSFGTMPAPPLSPPGASLQGSGTAARPSPELGPGQGWVRSLQLLPGPGQGSREELPADKGGDQTRGIPCQV